MTQTIQQALHSARLQFAAVSDTPALDAQVLLAEILGKDRAYVLAHSDQMLTEAQQELFSAWSARRAVGEPVAYILGKRAFYDREILVAPGVLIPRPETELLLEQALRFAGARPDGRAVDVGTGSGALAVTLAAHCPHITVYAVDISGQALRMAQINADRNHVTVQFFEGDLLTPLIEHGLRVDLVMANLPYIPGSELPGLEVSRFEPALALDGGRDGLDVVRRLLRQIPEVCTAGALVLLEIGAAQGEAAAALAREKLAPRSVEVLQDYAGLDRIVSIML